MPIALTVTESWRGTTEGASANQGDTGMIVFQVVGVVGTSDTSPARAAMNAVYAEFGVTVGSSYGGLSPLVCRSVQPRPVNPFMFEVVATFDVSPTGYYTPTTSPLLLPQRYEWKDCSEEQPFDRDVNNNPVVNSAGNSPNQPPTKRITKETLLVKRFEAFYDRATYKTYKNTVNSDTVTFTEPNGNTNVFPPGTMFCTSIAPEGTYTAADLCIPMVLAFDCYDLSEINITDPFQLHLLDEGYSGWYQPPDSGSSGDGAGDDGDDADSGSGSSTTTRGNFYLQDGDGNYAQVSEQVLLDGTGKPLTPPSASGTTVYVGNQQGTPVSNPQGTPTGATVETAQNNAAVYLKWCRYKAIPFTTIIAQPSAG